MFDNGHISFTYDENTHVTTCIRKGKHYIYTGSAKCHPSDYDFESKLVGEHYAFVRSTIAEMVAKRNEIKANIKLLEHIYNILELRPDFNYESTECYVLRRQLKNLERDLEDIKMLIKNTRKELYEFIHTKDNYYNTVRAARKAAMEE